tara:strand:+ start:2649 stop:3038 length:390 start_codon:yes stop_codon:yes gene_type:complete
MGHEIKPSIDKGYVVPKAWGKEIIIENNEFYCGKLLVFKANAKFSMHYHILKDETWYVQSGEFIYKWIDTEKGVTYTESLMPGDVVRQRVGQPHQLIARSDDSTIFEVSTTHYDEDSYRIYSGDSQRII